MKCDFNSSMRLFCVTSGWLVCRNRNLIRDFLYVLDGFFESQWWFVCTSLNFISVSGLVGRKRNHIFTRVLRVEFGRNSSGFRWFKWGSSGRISNTHVLERVGGFLAVISDQCG